MIQLINLFGSWSDIAARVVRCRYVEGSIHEVSVVFDVAIETGEFCAAAITRRVLLVEDDPSSARLTTFHLQKMNAEIVHVEDGGRAVEEALKQDFDVILMDMRLPVLDGMEATKQIRAAGCTTAIIAFTAINDPAERERCLAGGCDVFLPKPFTREDLTEALDLAKHEPLLSLFHGETAMADLIDAFVQELPKTIRALEEAFGNQDGETLRNLSQMLRGNAGSYGFEPISVAAAKLEAGIAEGQAWSNSRGDLREVFKWCQLARSPISVIGKKS